MMEEEKKIKKIIDNEKKVLKYYDIIEEKNKRIKDDIKKEIEYKKEEERNIDSIRKFNLYKKNNIKTLILRTILGSFLGIISDYTIFSSYKLSKSINLIEASGQYIISFLILIFLVAYHMEDRRNNLKEIFKEVFIIYFVAIFVIFFTNLIFGIIKIPMNEILLFKIISTNMILSIIGAFLISKVD